MKNCGDCGALKSESEFYKTRHGKPFRVCKVCHKARTYENRRRDPGINKRASKKYYDANRDRVLQMMKDYRTRNPEKMKALYYKSNAERYHADPERAKKAKAAWAAANPERDKMQRKAASARRRARLSDAPGSPTTAEQQAVFDSYHGKCVYCSSPATDVDHIKAIARGGCNHIENIAPACDSCNSSKGARSLLEFLFSRAKRAGLL